MADVRVVKNCKRDELTGLDVLVLNVLYRLISEEKPLTRTSPNSRP
jgi:hypothetical protein